MVVAAVLLLALGATRSLAADPPANPSPPAAVTGEGVPTGSTSATLRGVVTAGGAVTAARIEYGTTAAYGMTTGTIDVGETATGQPVSWDVVNLTAGTTYHLRLVATNAAGAVYGEDRTFTTPGVPRPPWAQTRSVVDLAPAGATLVARIDPRGQATTVYFEYGSSSSYGLKTASQTLPATTGAVLVRQPLGGLSANSTYSYRAVAVNAAGVGRGNRHTFRTTRGVTSVTMNLAARHVGWSDQAFIGGKVSGLDVNAVKVTLWQQDHPFTGAFRPVGTATASWNGTYGFTTKPLYWATRFRVTVDTLAGVGSSTATTIGDLRARVRVSSRARRTVLLRGLSYPATRGTARVQRRAPSGRWVTVREVKLTVDAKKNRSTFSARVSRLSSRSARYRAVIAPSDAGAHATTATRSTLVPRRR